MNNWGVCLSFVFKDDKKMNHPAMYQSSESTAILLENITNKKL